MNRVISAAVFAALLLGGHGAYGQSTLPTGAIQGRVLDERQAPVSGAMVSVVGRATVAATTDRDGRYTLKNLPYGPYILTVHSRGFFQSHARTIQLSTGILSAPLVQLARSGGSSTEPAKPQPESKTSTTNLAGFGGLELAALREAEPAPAETDAAADAKDAASSDDDGSETAWRLRHLPRSILKETATQAWVAQNTGTSAADWLGHVVTVGPTALFSDLALSGQINLLTTESFDRPGDMFGSNGMGHGVAFVSVGTQAAGGAWTMQGAMTEGDLSSWIVAGSYKSIESTSHAYDVGLTYSTQRYSGGNVAALAAMPDSARNAGTVYGYDQWTISPKLILGYGAALARYDYLSGAGVWSPRVSVMVPLNGLRITAVASQRSVVPGAEEFEPSATGLWLPPERTFSSLSDDGSFRPEQTRHAQLTVERDLAAGVSVLLRGFDQHVDDQLVEVFGVDLPNRATTPVGHYYVGTAGDFDARGWTVGVTQEIPGYVRAAIEYTVATAFWQRALDTRLNAGRLSPTENIYDLQTSVEATIPQTATKISAKYRMNTAFWNAVADALASRNANARFNIRVNQSLPFLRFSNADWEALFDIRNMFRDDNGYSSVYDEALAVRAPKRVVGGLMVKF